MLNLVDMSFDNFISDSSNRFALAVAGIICEKPRCYNPVVFYGKSGCGKTHLMSAVKEEFKTRNPNAKTCYVTADFLTNELVSLARDLDVNRLYEAFCDFDVLLIDDCDSLMGREHTQAIIANFIERLCKENTQVVLSVHNPLSRMPLFCDKIRENLEVALFVDIDTPSSELRREYFSRLCAENKTSIDDEAINLIVKMNRGNLPELQGFFKAMMCMLEISPTKKVSKEWLKKHFIFNGG